MKEENSNKGDKREKHTRGEAETEREKGGERKWREKLYLPLLKITKLPTNFLVGKPISDHLPTKLFSRNFLGR